MSPGRSPSPPPYDPKKVRVPKEVLMAPRRFTSPRPYDPKEVHVPKEVSMAPNVPRCPQRRPHGPREVPFPHSL